MLQLPILLGADLELIIKIVLVLLFVVGPAILKFFGGSTNQADRTPPPKQSRPPQRPRPQQSGNDLESEITEFLQRAGGDKRAEAPLPEAQPYYASERDMVKAEVVAPLPPITAHDELPSHLVETPEDALPSHGENVTDAVEAYLQAAQEPPREPEAYDYDLGGMDDEGNKLNTADTAAELAAMFRNPSDMRKVVVLNEIMNRPQRW